MENDIVDLNTETDAQLVDRLVQCAEEEDLLYVDICLRRLLARGVVDAVVRQHSWKGVSALVLVATSPCTKLRQLILQVLLFRLKTSTSSAFAGARLQSWSAGVVEQWSAQGRLNARQAGDIVQLTDEGAIATWMDTALANGDLPPPPNPHRLTGCGRLPLPPPPPPPFQEPPSPRVVERKSSLPPVPALVQLPRPPPAESAPTFVNVFVLPTPMGGQLVGGPGQQTFPLPFHPFGAPPLSKPTPPGPAPAYTPLGRPDFYTPQPLPQDDHPIRIRIGNLPANTSRDEIIHILRTAGTPISNLRTVSTQSGSATDGYGTLPSRSAWSVAFERLHLSFYNGSRIYLDRDRPDFQASAEERARHPVVVLDALPPRMDVDAVMRLGRTSRCGLYGVTADPVEKDGQQFTRGTFRTSSPAAANDAARQLNGAEVEGRRIVSWWEPAPPVPGPPREEAPVKTEEKGTWPLSPVVENPRSSLFPSGWFPPSSLPSAPVFPNNRAPSLASPTALATAVKTESPPPYSCPAPVSPEKHPSLPLNFSSLPPFASLANPAAPACPSAAENAFGGILTSRTFAAAPPSSSSFSSAADQTCPLPAQPPGSTPSPFLPGCGPRRASGGLKRDASGLEEGGEGEKPADGSKKKRRKVSFAG
ncbi:hypothetical protein JCM6882_000618 [Rhodosporidiobolus microsporus]